MINIYATYIYQEKQATAFLGPRRDDPDPHRPLARIFDSLTLLNPLQIQTQVHYWKNRLFEETTTTTPCGFQWLGAS